MVNYLGKWPVSVSVSEIMKVPDEVYARASELSEDRDMTMKEALRQMCREGGHDV
jgi:hypothetical protein